MTQERSYQVHEGEKVTSVMIYTSSQLIWGEVVTKEAIRVSTWLRTQAIPQFIYVHDARILMFGGANPKPQYLRELHLPSSQVIAFHIKPPDQDPLDYDPNEPMRKMEPTTAVVGWFHFEGFLRMSTQTNLERYLEVSKELFTSLYDVNIIQPNLPAMGVIHAPFALLRTDYIMFSARGD